MLIKKFTWRELRDFANKLDEKHLDEQVKWWGEDRGGDIHGAGELEVDYVLDEEGYCPKKEYNESLAEGEEKIEEVALAKGYPMLYTDLLYAVEEK